MLRLVFITALLSSLGISAFAANTPPDIQFKNLSATPITGFRSVKFEDLKGKIVLVDFWASWCEPCKEALPHYNKLYEKYKNRGVVFLGINEDDDHKERDIFLKAHPISFPVLADPEKKMAQEFKVLALPTLYVFDQKLKPVTLYRGFDDKKPQVLEKRIQELLETRK